jgi:hypothetical protein
MPPGVPPSSKNCSSAGTVLLTVRDDFLILTKLSDDPLEPLPQKPRGMHRQTYERLRAQADAADAEADALLVESMPGLKELLADSR